MRAQSLGLAWKIYLAYGMYMVVLGLLAIISPTVLSQGQFTAYVGIPLSVFAGENAHVASFIGFSFRAFGCMTVLVGLFKVFIALFPYRRGESWAWWTALTVGIVAYSFMFTYASIIGDRATLIFSVVGVLLLVSALAPAARVMLCAKRPH